MKIADKCLKKGETLMNFDDLYRNTIQNANSNITRSKMDKDPYRFSLENLKEIVQQIKRPVGKFYKHCCH